MRSGRSELARLLLVSLFPLAASGCGILIGNVKPVDEKSHSYGVMDLAKSDPDWIRLDPQKTNQDSLSANDTEISSTEIPDTAYQSRKTASIISVDSACRKRQEDADDENLRSLTNLLFLGMNDISLRKEQDLTLQGLPALQTTIRGKLNGEAMMLRTVVMRRETCIYDLVYLARPEHFEDNAAEFSRFVASLKLK